MSPCLPVGKFEREKGFSEYMIAEKQVKLKWILGRGKKGGLINLVHDAIRSRAVVNYLSGSIKRKLILYIA